MRNGKRIKMKRIIGIALKFVCLPIAEQERKTETERAKRIAKQIKSLDNFMLKKEVVV